MKPSPRGFLSEIFFSIQGEGPWAGRPQVFLRLAGCSLGCPWCDTKDAWERPAVFGVQGKGGEPNPVESARAADLAARVVEGGPGWLSITGGEPLEQAPFLQELLPLLRRSGFLIHFETAGVHPERMEALLPFLDQVSMDWKLPSMAGRDFRGEHRAFLKLLAGWEGEKAVKIVVGSSCSPSEAAEALEGVDSLCPGAVPVLQPLALPGAGALEEGSLSLCLGLARKWRGRFPSLRVLPQVHKLLGLP